MLPFASDLDVEGIHVQAPSEVIFLCGGPTDGIRNTASFQSLRDAFLQIADFPAIRGKDVIQAEDVTKDGFFFSHYNDVLAFETDLAQITELILLFCESVGSFAELGAFSMIDEIGKRLLVIVQDSFWRDDSFIKLGPLRFLERRYGAESVYVIDDSDVGMDGTNTSKLDKAALQAVLTAPLKAHFNKAKEPTTFDGERAGHIIKLMTGLIQDYGALNTDEILQLLNIFSISLTHHQADSYLLCAEAVGWIQKMRKGSNTLFFARDLRDAATLPLKKDASIKNKIRRRSSILAHWKDVEPARHTGILSVRSGMSR